MNRNKRRKGKEETETNALSLQTECLQVAEITYNWNQTDDEVTLYLDCSSVQPIGDDVSYEASKRSFTLHFDDDYDWICEFYEEIEESSFVVSTESSFIKIEARKMTSEIWPRLTKIENVVSELHVQTLRKDIYEKGNDYIIANFYVKSVKRDTILVDFKDKELNISFHTSDPKFLSGYDSVDENTRFIYRTTLKDLIVPNLSHFKLTASTMNVTMRKKTPKKWETLEESDQRVVNELKPVTDKWIPIVESALKSCDSDEETSGTVLPKDSRLLTQSLGNLVSEIKKPTCMVPPLNKSVAGSSHPVGLTGLDNLGNTCFMNSVIQTLVNTRELRDFFLESRFQRDINVENPLGFGGQLAINFALTCRLLWSGKHRSCELSRLKALVASKANQFTGFAQHDAQEFMAFFLDGLHEDLNRVVDRPYIEAKDWNGEPDEVFANDCWNRYKLRNDSAIVDLFQGQYKSKLICPTCQHVSITFDPFLYLSVPLPKKYRYVPIVFFSKELSQKPVRYNIKVCSETTVESFKEQISERTKVSVSNLRVFEVYKSKIQRFFTKLFNMSLITPKDLIFVFEIFSSQLAGEPVVEISVVQRLMMPNRSSKCSFCDRYYSQAVITQLKRCTKCYRASYCDQSCQKNHWSTHKANCKFSPELVGMPFILSLPQSMATFSKLSEMMESYSRYSVDLFQPPVHNVNSLQPNNGTVANATVSPCLNTNANSSHFSSATSVVDAGLSAGLQAMDNRSESSCSELIFDQTMESTTRSTDPTGDNFSTIGSPPIRIVIGQSRTERADPLFYIQPVNQHGVSLVGVNGKRLEDLGDTVLDLSSSSFFSMDWRNNEKMKNYVLVQSKTLDVDEHLSDSDGFEDQKNISLDQCLRLFTEPEILTPLEAWYCPKCKQHREATKEMSIWRLPSVLIVQLKRFLFEGYLYRNKIDKLVDYPVRGLDLSPYYCGPRLETSEGAAPIYDLYAVTNHYGNILGGHYTSMATLLERGGSNGNEMDWRLFDDSHVTWESESAAVSRSAYVLFYRRRGVSCDLSSRPKPSIPVTIATSNRVQTNDERFRSNSDSLDSDDDDGDDDSLN